MPMTHIHEDRTQKQLVLITGGNRGLGFAAAKKLAQHGLRVILTSRSSERANQAAAEIRASVPEADVQGMALDLGSLTDVRAFAAQIAEKEQALHVLIANAAALPAKQRQLSADGYEMTFAANHLGHFLLTNQLLPQLETAVRETGEARVVVISSRLHRPTSLGPKTDFRFDDLDMTHNYRPMRAYKNSKLANLWFTYELDRRMKGSGITASALCPNFVPETISSEATGMLRLMYRFVFSLLPFARSLDDATNTYLFVATNPLLKGVGGNFYGEQHEIASSAESYDHTKAAKLWQVSEALTANKHGSV